MVFLSLSSQEIKITMDEQELVLCSARKSKVAIAAKRRAPMLNLLVCDHWVLAGIPWPKTVEFRDLVGVAIAPVSNKIAVKSNSQIYYKVFTPKNILGSLFPFADGSGCCEPWISGCNSCSKRFEAHISKQPSKHITNILWKKKIWKIFK